MRLPRLEIEVSRQAAVHANAIGSSLMCERPAEVVLPAAQEPLHQTLGGIVEYASSFRLLSREHLLIYCAAALHDFQSPCLFVLGHHLMRGVSRAVFGRAMGQR